MSMSWSVGYKILKSVAFTCSKTSAGVFEFGSLDAARCSLGQGKRPHSLSAWQAHTTTTAHIPHNVQQLNDVRSTANILQNLDLPLNLLLLDGLEDLDDAVLTRHNIHAMKHLRIFTPPNLTDDLVVVLIPKSSNIARFFASTLRNRYVRTPIGASGSRNPSIRAVFRYSHPHKLEHGSSYEKSVGQTYILQETIY
jgi:hypothetical protein